MSTAVTPHTPWQTQIVQLLSPEAADATHEWMFLQFEDDRAFLAAPDPSQPQHVHAILSSREGRSWLAVPLGRESDEDFQKYIASDRFRTRLEEAQTVWQQLPKNTCSSDNIHEEIKQFVDSLASSRIATIDRILWWLVPLDRFQLVRQVVQQFGPPPAEVQRDWQHQRNDQPTTLLTIVSPTGWLIDLNHLVHAVRQDCKPTLAPSPSPAPSLAHPSIALTNPRPHRSTAVRGRSAWTPTRIAWGTSAAGLLLMACGGIYWSQVPVPPTSNQAALESVEPAVTEVAEVPIEISDEAPEELTTIDPQLDSMQLDSMQLDSMQLDSMSLDSISIDPISLESISDFKPMGAPKFDMEAEDLEASNPSPDSFTDPNDADPSMAPGDVVETDVAQVDMADPTQPLIVSEHMGFEAWGQRRDIRFGRGAHAKNGWCVAHLRLGEANAEKEPEWLVSPSDPQGIQGTGRCEWRVTKEESSVELVVRAFSKPGTRWQLVVLVGARTASTAEPVSIAPGQPSAVLLKLQSHLRTIQQTQEAWQAAPRPPRIRGMPDAASYTRWLRAQEKETEQAIEQWTRIAELADVLQASGILEYELSIASPTEPSPPATSPPAPGKAD